MRRLGPLRPMADFQYILLEAIGLSQGSDLYLWLRTRSSVPGFSAEVPKGKRGRVHKQNSKERSESESEVPSFTKHSKRPVQDL